MPNNEPALWLAAVQAILACAIGFGLHVSQEQFALIMATAAAIAGLIVRQSVTPNAKLAPPGSGSSLRMSGPGLMLVVGMVAMVGMLAPATARAQAPDSTGRTGFHLYWRHLAVGIGGVGVAYVDSAGARQPGFEPKFVASYDLTDLASFVGGVRGNLATRGGIAYVGLRDCLNPANKSWKLYAGADVRRYFGRAYTGLEHQTVSVAVLQGAWPLGRTRSKAAVGFLTIGADVDVANHSRKEGLLALEWQAWGGH